MTRDAKIDFGKSPALAAALLVLLTFLAYIPALRAGFVWDDDKHFAKNPAMLSVGGLGQIWSSLAVSRYYPLTLTSFWMERRLWGLHPLPYHAVNIVLQAVNGVLLWILLRRLKVRGAWLAAVVWALHPVNVESVAWITELKNTQSGMFFLLALLAFLQFEDRLRPRDYIAVLICGAAAMMSKPSTVVLPGVILLCAWWRRGRWTLKDLLRVTPLAALGVCMSLLTVLEQYGRIENQSATDWAITFVQRLLLMGHVVWFYAGKLFWPVNLCFIYPRWELQVHSIVEWLPLTALVLVAAGLWCFRRTAWARAAVFGLGCFLICLLPVLGIVSIYFFRFTFVADHFQYLASMALIALGIGTAATIVERIGGRAHRCARFLTATLLLVLGFSTWQRAHAYENSETLWRDTLQKNPKAWIAHNNLGLALQEQGRLTEALEQYEQALRLKPDSVEAQNNVGLALLQQGRTPEATTHFQQAVKLQPNNVVVLQNLGFALSQMDKTREAIQCYQHLVQLHPNLAEAHYGLALALEKIGESEEAIKEYQQALHLNPNLDEAQKNLQRLRAGQ